MYTKFHYSKRKFWIFFNLSFNFFHYIYTNKIIFLLNIILLIFFQLILKNLIIIKKSNIFSDKENLLGKHNYRWSKLLGGDNSIRLLYTSENKHPENKRPRQHYDEFGQNYEDLGRYYVQKKVLIFGSIRYINFVFTWIYAEIQNLKIIKKKSIKFLYIYKIKNYCNFLIQHMYVILWYYTV